MRYRIIETGSKGNATTLCDDTILVDCGVPYKAIKPIVPQLKIVFLSHIHSDHFKETTITALAKERPTLRFACGKWLVSKLVECGVPKRNIDVLSMNTLNDYKAFQVEAFELSHDVENCGYKFFLPDNFKIFYATDTNNLNGVSAPNYDLYLLEANYTEDDIRDRIKAKQVEGGYIYEYRALKNHMSKEAADEWLIRNCGDNSKFCYMHGHIPH